MASATTLQPERFSELDRLYDEYWEFIVKEFPTYATYYGDHRYDDDLDEISEEAWNRRYSRFRQFLEQLETFPRPSSGTQGLNYEIFQRLLKDALEESKFRPYLMPMDQQGGPHIEFPQIVTYHPFKTLNDYENYLSRLRKIPIVLEQAIAAMRTGIRENLVHTRIVVEKIIPQLEAQILEDPTKSEFYKPITTPPKNLSEEDVRNLRNSLKHAIQESVIPAYAKLLAFIRDEYLLATRKDVGIWSLPNGTERYAFYVRHYTTTNLTPEQIYDTGLRELARIHAEMKQVMEKLGFRGSPREFAERLRSDKNQSYPTGEALLNGFKDILKRMDSELPRLFGRLPKIWYDFREIELYRAEAAPEAYYYPPPEDGSRPGYFYVNTYKPETRTKYTMEALAYHEAVPGHHLQIALNQELKDLPKFRRFFGLFGGGNAFWEGWGLYSEQLPKEVGFYSDPYQEFGRLTLEAWRAARLVVDTGIHKKRWTREQAIHFFEENTALSEHNIESEVDRYIAWPGQALAYKIGQLKILELRERAERLLGSRFDIRKFHDELLGDGALALDVLEKKMERWLQAEVKS